MAVYEDHYTSSQLFCVFDISYNKKLLKRGRRVDESAEEVIIGGGESYYVLWCVFVLISCS